MRPSIRRTHRAVAVASVLTWLVTCLVVYRGLVKHAADAPPNTIEDYARDPSFQLLNFGIGYLPIMLGLLAIVLVIEWGSFRLLDWALARRARQRS
jgi:hypothetical protein